MGTIRNGGNGAFSGKAGSFIGSNWKSINYIKGIPKLSNKPASLKQLDQRMRFGVALAFISKLKDMVNLGFKSQAANRSTALNMALQHTVDNAVLGTYPDISLDPALVLVSKGTVEAPTGVTVIRDQVGITINWFVNITKSVFGDDKLYVAVYNPTRDRCLNFEEVATRAAGTAQIILPAEFITEPIHVYLFFNQRESFKCSTSEHIAVGV